MVRRVHDVLLEGVQVDKPHGNLMVDVAVPCCRMNRPGPLLGMKALHMLDPFFDIREEERWRYAFF